MSARFAGSSKTDMFLPKPYCFVAAILALLRGKDNTGVRLRTFQQRRPCERRDPHAAARR
jgi:hypothetical protein